MCAGKTHARTENKHASLPLIRHQRLLYEEASLTERNTRRSLVFLPRQQEITSTLPDSESQATRTGRLRLKCDCTCAETIFSLFGRNGRVHLNRRGGDISSVDYWATEVCASAVIMLDTPCSEVVWRVLATQSIRQFPLHFSSRALPCTITFQLDSTYAMPGSIGNFQHAMMGGTAYEFGPVYRLL